MNTLKSLLFVAIMSTFFACQESDEIIPETEIEDAQLGSFIINNCHAYQCAAKVIVQSPVSSKQAILGAAINEVRQRAGYNDAIFVDRPRWKYKKVIHPVTYEVILYLKRENNPD
ncbi:MAG: hypothetical protein AAGA66_08880 [Bacteroidota bacterium]